MNDIERLAKRYEYNKDTGDITYRIDYRGNAAGSSALKPGIEGYLRVGNQLAHRVAWALHYGKHPRFQIDHIDQDRKNNKIRNLRDANKRVNAINSVPGKRNKSGVRGVFYYERISRWAALMLAGTSKKKAVFTKDFFEAVCARKSSEAKILRENL